jgi:hypothetical protein
VLFWALERPVAGAAQDVCPREHCDVVDDDGCWQHRVVIVGYRGRVDGLLETPPEVLRTRSRRLWWTA